MNRNISTIFYGLALMFIISCFPYAQTYAQNRCLGGLNGASNYATIPSSTDFDLSSQGMIEMWVYPLSAVGAHDMTLVSKGESANHEFMLTIEGNQILTFWIGQHVVEDIAVAPVPVHQWSHIAVGWAQTGSTYNVYFYINGGGGSPSTMFTPTTWQSNSDPIKIGGGNPFGQDYVFDGYIDEVRIWNRTRVTGEIAQSRFVSVGNGINVNSGGALSSGFYYSHLISSWTFNDPNIVHDYISGHDGSYNGNAGSVSTLPGQPIPYNMALKVFADSGDFVTVQDNPAFNTSNSGTLEAWVNHASDNVSQKIITRGITGHEFNWGVDHASGNKQMLEIGSTVFINSDGPAIPLNKWVHLAVVWFINGGQYTVLFYINGQQSGSSVTMPATWNSLSGTLRIGGWHGSIVNNWNGYLDEVRYWNSLRMVDTIRNTMFISCRSLASSPDLVAAWNFDGNLKNLSSVSGLDGTFSNNFPPNFSRFSSYQQEITIGPFSTDYTAYPTVVDNSNTTDNYIFSVHNAAIPDLGSISDTIQITKPGTVINAEVLVSIQHQLVNDLNIRLKAPNGVSKDLCLRHGSFSASGMLTAFNDAQPSVTLPNFYPPWSGTAAPDVAMGNFGASVSNGPWVLTVEDAAAGNTGTLLGWGLKLNISPIGIQPISGIVPKVFQLYQNYPNPFNPTTDIKFDIPKDANVKVKIYDILGREVASVINEFKKAGEYSISYDASNLASGIYIYKIEANDLTDAKKMILIK